MTVDVAVPEEDVVMKGGDTTSPLRLRPQEVKVVKFSWNSKCMLYVVSVRSQPGIVANGAVGITMATDNWCMSDSQWHWSYTWEDIHRRIVCDLIGT